MTTEQHRSDEDETSIGLKEQSKRFETMPLPVGRRFLTLMTMEHRELKVASSLLNNLCLHVAIIAAFWVVFTLNFKVCAGGVKL